ncbi:MarR family winged helix-turn-helix transcriptional regulator [Flagellimonas meishanensis]|uniref:MarR family winged helix-turn-helix transcriptional regulator n=1 Tax=Flagellimonas meishanensis TaxID=2873264 RepID=UPI001CA609D0|nr:MarR family winged helix-turn-helix transcriptional regulator [[Muricauda] meishanensis]
MINKKLIAEIRSFNRFYVKILGLHNRYLHNSGFNLIEARIIYEVFNNQKVSATDLTHILGVDKGYLSRVLKKLGRAGLLDKVPSSIDGRTAYLRLSDKGIKTYNKLNHESDIQIESLIAPLKNEEKKALIISISKIQQLLSRMDG